MSDTLERAVRAALPHRTVESIASRTNRPGNAVAYVTFTDADPLYVKTATDATTRLVAETAATRYATHCAVRAPTVVAADPDGDPPYLVTEPLTGTPLSEAWTGDRDRAALLRQAGRAIAGIHTATTDGPGVIVGGDAETLELAGASWADVLCRTVEWRTEDLFADRFADLPDRLVETIRAVEPTLEGPTPTLLHGDCTRSNVYLEPEGVIDWERGLAGDPAFDLVDAAYHLMGQPDVDDDERPGLVEALHAGYRDRAGSLPAGFDRRHPVYRAIAFLSVPQAFEEWAGDAPEPKEDLAAWVREEFEARLATAREEMI